MPVPFSFDSADTGAPVLSGQAGAGVALYDALFSTGYNSQSVTSISRSGTTATVVKTAHGFADKRIIRNAGWAQTDYNVDAQIVRIDADSYSYQVANSPTSPGTGSGTAKVAPLDWTIDFTGTNLRSYRPAIGNRYILGVDDTGTTTCRVRGFESMTAAGVAVASGSGPFPTDAQLSGGDFWDKSITANATARAWRARSNGKLFYMRVNYGGSAGVYSSHGFGDGTSLLSSADAYFSMMIGESAASASGLAYKTGGASTDSVEVTGFFIARSYTQSAGSVVGARRIPRRFLNAAAGQMGVGVLTYPAPIAGGLVMCRMYVGEGATVTGIDDRGYMPGFWVPAHNKPFTDGDTFSGVAGTELAGKTFEVFDHGNLGQIFIQTDDWN